MVDLKADQVETRTAQKLTSDPQLTMPKMVAGVPARRAMGGF